MFKFKEKFRMFSDGGASGGDDTATDNQDTVENKTDTADRGDKSSATVNMKKEEYDREMRRIATKEAKSAAEKARVAMLKELGMDEDGYKAYLEAKRNKETDSDKLKRESETLKETRIELEKSNATVENLSAENVVLKNIVAAFGYNEKQLRILKNTIKEDVNDEVDIQAAAAAYFKENPVKKEDKQKPPPTYGGSKSTAESKMGTKATLSFSDVLSKRNKKGF